MMARCFTTAFIRDVNPNDGIINMKKWHKNMKTKTQDLDFRDSCLSGW